MMVGSSVPRHASREAAAGPLSTAYADHDLERFVDAQDPVYAEALAEIRRGAKRSHWMWFVFPQISGLGTSLTARRFAIRSIDEAKAYLAHPLLGARYRECVSALQDLEATTATEVFGATDAAKLGSSLTLFSLAGAGTLVDAALARWAGGRDLLTLEILAGQGVEAAGSAR